MADKRIILGIALLGAIAYAARTYAAVDETAQPSTIPPDTGNWFSNWFGPSYTPASAQSEITPYYDDSAIEPAPQDYDITALPAYTDSSVDQEPPFVYPDVVTTYGTGAAMTNYKVNEYPKYADFIANIERKYNLPPDLLARLLYQESRYRVDVIEGINRSKVGALGIAQFMPATAAEMMIDPLEPFQAIDAAGKYLKQMYGIFHTWPYALAAYNWGPGNMKKFLQGERTMPQETQNYMAQITADVSIA